jgi:Terpene synthase family 2, C-terminal metal binding
MQLYTIPALYCPFPPNVHPLRNEIEDHTNQWLLDFHLIDSHETFLKYKKSRFPAFIARCFPYADFVDICAWSDLNALLFILDDKMDEQDLIKDKESFLQLESDYVEILVQNKKFNIETDNPMFAALSDFWHRIILRSSVTWQQKFIQAIRDMFAGGMWQFEHILKGIKPDFDQYMKLRQFFGAAHLATDVLEITGKISLPDEIYCNPTVHKVTELCRNEICISNDLFSFAKEIEESQHGGEFNLVSILKHKHTLSIEDAIKATVDFHDNLVREFIETSQIIYVYDDDTNKMLKKYVQALGCLMIANIEWSIKETTRYPHIYAGRE